MTRDLTNSVGEWGMGVVPNPDTDTPGAVAEAATCIRALNHLLSNGGYLPAPTLYRMMGDLSSLLHGLDQALPAMGDALARSLDEPSITVYNSDGPDPRETAPDPRETVEHARGLLARAAERVGHAAHVVGMAHTVIAVQGYNPTDDEAPS